MAFHDVLKILEYARNAETSQQCFSICEHADTRSGVRNTETYKHDSPYELRGRISVSDTLMARLQMFLTKEVTRCAIILLGHSSRGVDTSPVQPGADVFHAFFDRMVAYMEDEASPKPSAYRVLSSIETAPSIAGAAGLYRSVP